MKNRVRRNIGELTFEKFSFKRSSDSFTRVALEAAFLSLISFCVFVNFCVDFPACCFFKMNSEKSFS